jgi:hypothetical protein
MAPVSNGLKKATQKQPQLPVWITHMWQRLHEHKQLGLLLGAGVSIDAGCPSWTGLVDRLAVEEKIPKARITAHRKAGLQESYVTEMLFQMHGRKEGVRHRNIKPQYYKFQISSSWAEKIHRCLYADIRTKSFEELLNAHTYLSDLGELVYGSAFTVNFNFDDIVDEAVFRYAGITKRPNPEVLLSPKPETRRAAPVVYHINGYLPREEIRRRSEHVVLTEDAFAEVLLSTNSVDAEFVTAKFATTTFLILGSSLNDSSLKNLLRAGAKRNPANHHYIVYWENPDRPRTGRQKREIFDVNLSVYNLISIFMTTLEIGCLIKILNENDQAEVTAEITALSKEKICRKYYLVGPVAGGKSSTLEAMRCFSTHEEWLGRPPALMYQNERTLTKEQQALVDDFLFPQLMEKNRRMVTAGPGIHVMDRAYFDLFAFSNKKTSEVLRKAKELKSRISGPGSDFADGQIIFMEASEPELEARLARRGKRRGKLGRIVYDATTLLEQAATLKKIYRPKKDSQFDTSFDGSAVVAQRIARKILLKKYQPLNFNTRLNEIISSRGKI